MDFARDLLCEPTGAQLSQSPWVVYQQDTETIANLHAALRHIGAKPPRIAIEPLRPMPSPARRARRLS